MSAFLPGLELVFGWLIAASWQASVLAVAVLAIQRLFGARLNPRWRYALWLLVVLRLVLPVLPESALSLFQFAPPPPAALTVSVTEPLFTPPPSLPPVGVPVALVQPERPISFYSLLAVLWLAGALVLLLLTLVVNRRFAQQVAASPEITDPELLRLFAAAKAEFQVRRPIRLIENGQVQSPAIMGLFQPTLLLPVDVREKFDARELRFIFLHELAHLKRGDVVVQMLIALLQILHWFNPVLWFAFRRMRIDREPATDALVLSRTGEDEKERYGLMLIKLLEHFNQRHSLATLVGILEDKDQFKRRFGLIARFTRGAYGWSLLGVIILAALAIVGLTESRHAFQRDPSLPLVIDLKPFYGRVFADAAGADSKYKGYSGTKTIDGLPFDIGGQIELFGKEEADRNKDHPESVSGIKIDRKFDELHLVHAVEWREYYGCPVATIRLHYADGAVAEFSIRFNQQVNDWSRLFTEDAEIIDDPATKIIWRGPGGAEGAGRLFKSVFANPFPDKKVDTMDVVSTRSGCSYMLVAATVAQREPGREVTPSLPLAPPRNFLGQLKVHVVDKKTGAPIAGAEIYPAMVTGDISLVADNLVTPDDGAVVVKYPTGGETIAPGSGDATNPKYPTKGASDLRLKVTRAGYNDCEIHWMTGWNAGEIPQEVTYRLTPVGATDLTGPDFTVTGSTHPTVLAAVKQGDAAGLQKLIDQGAELPKVDDQGEPLIFAVGSAEVAEILLKHGADANALDKYKRPVIVDVSLMRRGQAAAIVEVLLQHGADPNLRFGSEGSTPLMEAQDAATVDVLVAHGADVKAKLADGDGIMATIGGQRPDYLDALIRHGAAFDPKTDGPSILVHAAWQNNVEMVKAVLDRGVDPNLPGLWGRFHGKPDMMKPMVAAVINGHLEIAGLFLKHGAKVEDESMRTALANRQAKIVKFFWENNIRPISELAYATSQSAPVADLEKLLDTGASLDAPQDESFTPLEIAAQLGNLDAVKLFVSRGAAVNETKPVVPPTAGPRKNAVLIMAASEGQDEVISYLLAHGATPTATALSQAAENSTPYPDQKAKDHFEKSVRMLIDAGALKNATPDEKGTILASALGTRQGPPNLTVAKMVLDAGVSPEAPMPYIVGFGEKPNSVIGYYRSEYAKDKDDPESAYMTAQLKPVLDLLEAAEKGASTGPDQPAERKYLEATFIETPGAMNGAGEGPLYPGDADKLIRDPANKVAVLGSVALEDGPILLQGKTPAGFDYKITGDWKTSTEALQEIDIRIDENSSRGFGHAWETKDKLSREQSLVVSERWKAASHANLLIRVVDHPGSVSSSTGASGPSPGASADPKAGTTGGTIRELVLGLYDRARAIAPNRDRLQILQAFYGADSSWRDVTEVLKKSVQNNSLKISWQQPYAEIGGDPAYLQVKTLVVSYRLDGVEKVSSFREENPPVGLRVTLPMPSQAGGEIDAEKPGDATVSGQLTIPVAAHADFAKSSGVLVSDAGGQYPIAFDKAGGFVVFGVAPGRYRAVMHVVCEPRDIVVGVDKTFGFTDVAAGAHATLNLSWDPTPPAKGGVEIGLKIVQIDEDVYQANKTKIDASVEKGGAEAMSLLNQMKGVSLLSTPSVTTKPGLKANVDIVREMPYPTQFEHPKTTPFVVGSPSTGLTNMTLFIPPTPREFQTKNIGVSAEITPELIGKTLSPQGTEIPSQIMLSGNFTVAEFEGFTQSNLVSQGTPTFTTSESHFVEALADGELKGVWIPGSHYRTADALNQLPGVKTDPNAPTIKTRYLLFLSAKEVD